MKTQEDGRGARKKKKKREKKIKKKSRQCQLFADGGKFFFATTLVN